MNLILMLLGFSLLVAVHEFGHFLLARLMGMSVSSFSIGFGPILFRRLVGETEYRISAIPLGGYVQIVGHMPDDEANKKFVDEIAAERSEERVTRMRDSSTWYCNKSGVAQFLTILAGPLFSLLLAVPLFWSSLMMIGSYEVHEPITVVQVEDGSPASEAGFQAGDEIVGVNGKSVVSYTDFVIALTECDLASPIPISINRAGESVETMLSFANSAQPQLGVVLLGKELELSPTEAVGAAVEQTIEMVKLQGTGMAMLISGQASTSGVSGPVGIFSIGTSAAGNGAGAFFHFLAVITVALGLFNLLPIPMLDGGHLVFSTFKIFTGKNVSARVQTAFIFAGLALLLTFVLLATLQDIGRLFGS